MSTEIKLSPNLANPRLRLSATTDRDRMATEGCIGEWDMATFSSGTQMTDLSGNGNDFIFTSAPSLGATGWNCNGSIYADMVLAAPLVDNYSALVVVKGAGGGYYTFGNQNVTDQTGFAFRQNNNVSFYVGQANNGGNGPACSNTIWTAVLGTVDNGQARCRATSAGRLATSHVLRAQAPTEIASPRARWRLGAVAQTTGGNHDAPYNILPTGCFVAYAMLFNKVKSYAEGFCLHEYVKAKMAVRGITYS